MQFYGKERDTDRFVHVRNVDPSIAPGPRRHLAPSVPPLENSPKKPIRKAFLLLIYYTSMYCDFINQVPAVVAPEIAHGEDISEVDGDHSFRSMDKDSPRQLRYHPQVIVTF